jgi:ankyrin repeat protein
MLNSPDIDIHSANEKGNTLVHYAAKLGREDILQLLLDKGFLIDDLKLLRM